MVPSAGVRRRAARAGLAAATVIAAIGFLALSRHLNRDQIWFSNVDQDSMLLIGALNVNCGRAPTLSEHPALGAYLLHASLLRVFRLVGVVPVSSTTELAALPDPLLALPSLYRAARLASGLIAFGCVVLVALALRQASSQLWLGVGAAALALFSSGLLFQALVVRTELASVFYALLAALLCAWSLRETRASLAVLAGICAGLALVSKVQILPVLFLAGWFFVTYKGPAAASLSSRRELVARAALVGLLWAAPILPLFGFAPSLEVVADWAGVTALAALVGSLRSRRSAHSGRSSVLLALAFVAGLGWGVRLACHLTQGDLQRTNQVFALALSPASYLKPGPFVELSPELLGAGVRGHLLHYGSVAFVHLAFVGIGLIVCRRLKPDALACYGLGIAYALVNSLRGTRPASGLSEHYMIYVDLPFACASALVARDVIASARRHSRRRASLAVGALAVIGLASGLAQWRSVAVAYPRYNPLYRDRIDHVPAGFYPNESFHGMLLARYGSDAAIIRRILEDDRLNGRREGIVLERLPGVRGVLVERGWITPDAGR